MDAAARRRAIRKRKILQNAEDRIKKLTGNVGADDKHEENFDQRTNFCEGNDNTLRLHGINDGHQNVNMKVHQNTATHQDKPIEMQDKTDGYVRKDRVHETDKQQIDENFHDQTTTHNYKEQILDVEFSKHQNEPTEIQDKTDGYIRKERVPETINEQPINGNGTELNPEPEANTLDNKVTNVRPVVVMIFATLCFTKSLYLPVISSILGSPWFLEIYSEKEFSFITPFCILEIVLFFTPSIRKVTPGKQVNIWLLALKLCGVSPGIVDTARIVILEILEFLTDLAMFIFVLVILQNVKELY